ncbi:MAG: hypothetical protein K6F33_00655 [Bacteroidales bacterium]|nr:hypothetical protein [Bacteroidales bacterium]
MNFRYDMVGMVDMVGMIDMVALTDYPLLCRTFGASRNGVSEDFEHRRDMISRHDMIDMVALTDHPLLCRTFGASRKYSAMGATSQRIVREGYRTNAHDYGNTRSAMGATSQRIVRKGYRNVNQNINVNPNVTAHQNAPICLVFALLFLFTLVIPATAQSPIDEYDYLKLPTLLSDTANRKVSARFYGHTFFKNNEYFGNFVKGYTLTGYHLQPEISYNPNRKLKVQALWDVLKYHGYDKFSKNKPYFRIVFQPTDSFRIICGYLDGDVRHGLIEPIYDPERGFTAEMENGLQLNLMRPRYDGELWLNWEKMILWGDPWKERLTVGHISKIHVADKQRFKSDLLAEFLVAHRGGQIDSCEGEVQSLTNFAAGMDFHWMGNGGGCFRQLSIRAMAVGYHAIDETADLPWVDGCGTYLKAHLRLADFGLTLGHWFGYKFLNFRGDLLYTGWAIDPINNRAHRYMLTFGCYYSKRYFDDTFVLRTGVDTWYDLAAGDVEYAYMISMAVNFTKAFGKKL